MATEYEFKYKADYDSLTAINISSPQVPRVIEMETVYFDTRQGSLAKLHYTLRRRKENDKYICTIKAPAPEAKQTWKDEVAAEYNHHPSAVKHLTGAARNEWEVECERIEDALPLLVAQGAPKEVWRLAAEEGLISVCGAKFRRIARTIKLRDAEVEEALDSGYLLGGNKQQFFYELEVEVKSGNKVTAGRYANDLANQYDLEPETESKFARALKLYKGE